MDPTRRRRTVIEVLAMCLVAMTVIAFLIGGGQVRGPASRRLSEEPAEAGATSEDAGEKGGDSRFDGARQRMVKTDLAGRDITDARVLAAMAKVPRHCFVPERLADQAYDDSALPIGHGQTISQPYIVALMTQLAKPTPESRALDVGTGSGYQAAVLAEVSKEVYSIEIVKPLADEARKRLADLGYKSVTVRSGDGYRGWQDKAPFEVIIVAAAPDHVPQPLVDQLAPGGRLVIPVGAFYQELLLVQKDQDGTVHRKSIIPVMFVPMTGEAQQQSP